MPRRASQELEEKLLSASESGRGVPWILDSALAAMGREGDEQSWGAVFAERESGHEVLQASSRARPDRVERLLRWMRRGEARHLVVERANSSLSVDGTEWTKVCASVGGSQPGDQLTVVLCWLAAEVVSRTDADLIRAARFAAATVGPRCSLHVPVEAPFNAGSELLFEGSASAMILADLSGRVRRVNASARAILGRETSDVEGSPWTDFVHADDRKGTHLACMELLMGLCKSSKFELRWIRSDGEAVLGEATVTMLADRDQRPWNIVVVLECLTPERVERRTEAEQARARFRSVFEQAPVGMVDACAEGNIRSANRQFCEMLGYSEFELVGRSWASITDPADIAQNFARRQRAIAERESPYSMEKRYLAKDGRSVPASVHVSIVRDARGEVESLFAIIEDLTEKRELEAQLLQTAKMESLGRLAGGISHDFGNLLAAITGSVSLAQGEIEAGRREEALSRLGEVRSAAESAKRLTRQLLGFARRETPKPRAVSVAAVCERVVSMLRRLTPLGITVRLELGEGRGTGGEELWRARGDTGQIEQVVLNLALNARDAIEPPGVVTITVNNERLVSKRRRGASGKPGVRDGEWVRISVSDTGTGISAVDLPRIFEPFYTTKRTGFGLGLANVYSLVKQWGGDVQATSKPGRGSRFDVWLPRAGAELDLAEATEPGSAATREAGAATGGEGASGASMGDGSDRPLALVVDDQPEIRDLVRVIFERSGYRVKVAIDGREGMELVRTHAGELSRGGVVLTDQRLPYASGLEVAAVCRALTPETAVVLCSGDTSAVEIEAKALGARLLPKPFGPSELLAAVRGETDARSSDRMGRD